MYNLKRQILYLNHLFSFHNRHSLQQGLQTFLERRQHNKIVEAKMKNLSLTELRTPTREMKKNNIIPLFYLPEHDNTSKKMLFSLSNNAIIVITTS